MNVSADLNNLAIDTTAADQQPCSQCSGAAPETKASFKPIDRALRSNNHLPANSSGVKTPYKALSSSSSMGGDFRNIYGASEEHQNGKETLGGEDEVDEALRALESYAAFQVTLLSHIESHPTFNVSSQ
jgi:hypothetical protein